MIATPDPSSCSIRPRLALDFDLAGDIPRFWLAGDPFKTRFFDAMSIVFPESERFFMSCVRDFRDQITDPVLRQQVKDFTQQEAQHGRVHEQFNARLKSHGIAVERLEQRARQRFNGWRQRWPRGLTLAQTAASEHLTASISHSLAERADLLAGADSRIRAMYFWHAVEEIEHKAVAFDVMQAVARVSYPVRMLAMLHVSVFAPLHLFAIMRHMLRVDGFNAGRRLRIWGRGLIWLYGREGLIRRLFPHYRSFFRPGFHPWACGNLRAYQCWIDAYERSADPVAASDRLARLGLIMQAWSARAG